MSETLDIVNEDGTLSRQASRDEAHRLGLWHVIFHAWIVADDGAPRLLLQRRALTTELNPGLWDISAAGHYQAGEGGLDGLREIEEEIGYRPHLDQVRSVGRYKLRFGSGRRIVNELCDVFLVTGGPNLDTYRPSLDEVSALGYVLFADLEGVLAEPSRPALVHVITSDGGGWIVGTEWVDSSSFGESKAALLAEVYPSVAAMLSGPPSWS